MLRRGPQHLRSCVVVTDEDVAARIQRLIVRVGGVGKAIEVLGVGKTTFDGARWCGRMTKKTRARLLDALDRAEAAA